MHVTKMKQYYFLNIYFLIFSLTVIYTASSHDLLTFHTTTATKLTKGILNFLSSSCFCPPMQQSYAVFAKAESTSGTWLATNE